MLTLSNALTPSHDEYTIAALLSQRSIVAVQKIQEQLHQQLGDAIWLTPANCLHMTVMEIICSTDYGNTSRKQLFSEWCKQYAHIAKEVIAEFPAFTIDFTELHVSPAAIIIKTKEPGRLNELRVALLAKISLPAGTKLPPDIGHSTIARYKSEIEVEMVENAAKSIDVAIAEPVTELGLIEGFAPPRLQPVQILRYPLGP